MNQIAANTIEGRAMALIERIENLQKQIEMEQEACAELCAPHREDIAELWKEAKEAKLPEKSMRAALKVRTAARKAVAKLTDDERDRLNALREAMGPLGEWAAAQVTS